MTSDLSTKSTVEIKQIFLRTQARLLSQPLQPSLFWQTLSSTTTSSSTSDSDTNVPPLPEQTLNDVLQKLNTKLKSHSRLVFSSQSIRHVAEQIDALYWNELTSSSSHLPNNDNNDHIGATVYIARDTDLTLSPAVLPTAETLTFTDPAQRKEYDRLRTQVTQLVTERDEKRKKLEGYRRLRELVRPFEDVASNVQPNLVGRDGEVARELERFRVLVARVEAGLGQGIPSMGLDGNEDGDREGGVLLSEREKLARVMELG